MNFGYTFTDSYDANTCDPDELAAYDDNECRLTGNKVVNAKVRVPRHAFESNITYSINKNLKSFLKGKYISETRDFGNGNNSFADVILEDYTTIDFASKYTLFDGYNLTFQAINIFDDNYEQAHQYSSMGRSFNIGLKRIY